MSQTTDSERTPCARILVSVGEHQSQNRAHVSVISFLSFGQTRIGFDRIVGMGSLTFRLPLGDFVVAAAKEKQNRKCQ
jgi:hypothetical protein